MTAAFILAFCFGLLPYTFLASSGVAAASSHAVSFEPSILPANASETSVDVQVQDNAIYSQAYYQVDDADWQSIRLTQDNTGWLPRSAEVSLDAEDASEAIRFAYYSCSWNEGWNCPDSWQFSQLSVGCGDSSCSANGQCYSPGATLNETGELCYEGDFVDVPEPSNVDVTLDDVTSDEKTTVSFTTEGFDIEEHPYHVHVKLSDGEHMSYEASPITLPAISDDRVCILVANRNHTPVSDESCADVQNEREKSVTLDKVTREDGSTMAYFSTSNYTNGEQYHTHFTARGSLLKMHFGQSPAELDTSADEVCAFVADENHNAVSDSVCQSVSSVADDGEQLWSNPATWNGSVPGEGDVAAITEDMHVVLDESTPDLEAVRVHGGTLEFARRDLELTAGNIRVMNGGEFRVGTEEDPFTHEAVITLTGTRKDLPGHEHCGVKGLCAHGAKLALHGATGETWTQLADGATAEPGDTSITVEERVGWEAGDEIVLASTDYDPGLTEKRTVTGVDGNTISFDEPLDYMHYSNRKEFGGEVLDQRAEVLNLDRNIVIQGDKQSGESNFGGHVMAMNEHHDEQMERVESGEEYVDVWPEYDNNESLMPEVSGVEFKRMGQAGILARYPFHWHLYGNASGSYIEDSSIHNSYQRCVTVHGTQGARVEGNVAFNTTGHCYFLEDGAEWDNEIRDNAASVVVPFDNESRELIPSDNRPAGIWLRNVDNEVVGNHIAGVFGYGIWVDSKAKGSRHPTGPSATKSIDLRRGPQVDEFDDNTMHSIANVWRHPNKNKVHENTVHDTDRQTGAGLFLEFLIGGSRTFAGTTTYHNDGIGLWAASRGDVWMSDSITADVPVGIKARARTDNVTVIGDTDNDGNPRKAGSGLVPNEFSFKKTWYTMTLDDLHYYENRTDRSLPAYMGLGLPQPDDLPMIGQENHYTGTISRDVTYVNFEDQGIINYSVYHTAGSPEAEGHWHWDTELENAPFSMRARGAGGGNNPRMFTMLDADGSISGDGDYTEYRYYDYNEGLAAHQAPRVAYRGEMRQRHMTNRSAGPVEDVYITDDCVKTDGGPRVWRCESETAMFSMKPFDPFGDGVEVEQESTGETFTDASVHTWLPVNETYHYKTEEPLSQWNIALANLRQGTWMAFSAPVSKKLEPQVDDRYHTWVESEEELYAAESGGTILYYDEEASRQYVRFLGPMEINDGSISNKKGPGAILR